MITFFSTSPQLLKSIRIVSDVRATQTGPRCCSNHLLARRFCSARDYDVPRPRTEKQGGVEPDVCGGVEPHLGRGRISQRREGERCADGDDAAAGCCAS